MSQLVGCQGRQQSAQIQQPLQNNNSYEFPSCSAHLQLKKLREAAEQSARKEAAAKAVLAAARDAAREGRSLSAEERSSVERRILNPQAQQQSKPAPPQVTNSPSAFQYFNVNERERDQRPHASQGLLQQDACIGHSGPVCKRCMGLEHLFVPVWHPPARINQGLRLYSDAGPAEVAATAQAESAPIACSGADAGGSCSQGEGGLPSKAQGRGQDRPQLL